MLDDSSPDYDGSNTDAGSPVQPCHDDDQTACSITSQTVATSPADQTRLKLGAGEEVNLTYSPGDATWALSGAGSISFNPGDDSTASITFTAADTAGSATITATGDNGTASITFNVVVPSSMHVYKMSGSVLIHSTGRVENGFYALVYVHPNDVNFYRVMIREKDSQGIGTKCCESGTGHWHGKYTIPDDAGGANVSNWVSLVNHTDAYGTNTSEHDTIWLVAHHNLTGDAAPFNVGQLSYTIIWQWKVTDQTTVTNFPPITQAHTITADGSCQSAKNGDHRTSLYNDPYTAPPDWEEPISDT